MGNGSGGGSSEPAEILFSASENSSSVRHTDKKHIAYFDDGIGTITEGTNYSEYLSYDNQTGKFNVLKAFSALVMPFTYNYQSASSTHSRGEFYINDAKVEDWQVNYTGSEYYAGRIFAHTFAIGDTFYQYTPVSDGYPEQRLAILKVDSSLVQGFTDLLDLLPVRATYWEGGIGSVKYN